MRTQEPNWKKKHDSNTFIALSPFSTSSIKFGKSLYASGPTTKSTIFSSSINLSFNLSAIQPNIPIFTCLFIFFMELKVFNLFLMVSSAFSLIEQVFSRIKSAFFIVLVVLYPFLDNTDATISLSLKSHCLLEYSPHYIDMGFFRLFLLHYSLIIFKDSLQIY